MFAFLGACAAVPAGPSGASGDKRLESDIEDVGSWQSQLEETLRDEVAQVASLDDSGARASCVAAFTVSGAVGGELLADGCVAVGVGTAYTGVGAAVAVVCGAVTVSQVDVLLGSLIGSVVGFAWCNADMVWDLSGPVSWIVAPDDGSSSAGAMISARLTTDVQYACRELGLTRDRCRCAIHKVKDGQLGAADDVEVDTETGDIYDRGTGEWVGNLYDEDC